MSYTLKVRVKYVRMLRLSLDAFRNFLPARSAASSQHVAFAGSKPSTTGAKSAEIKKIIGVKTSEDAPTFKGPEEVLNEASRDGKLKSAMETDGSIKQKTSVNTGNTNRKFSTSTVASAQGGSSKSPKTKEAGNIVGQVVGHEGLESTKGAKPEKPDEWSESQKKKSSTQQGKDASADRSHTKTIKDT